jgi:hypothetical protein
MNLSGGDGKLTSLDKQQMEALGFSTMPVIAAKNPNIAPGEAVSLSSIFSISGADITQYKLWFSWAGGGAPALGTLTNNGTAVPLNQPVTFTGLSALVYTGPATAGTDKIWLQAYNGSWSNNGDWTEADILDQGTQPVGQEFRIADTQLLRAVSPTITQLSNGSLPSRGIRPRDP